jgi:hypothetical protein
MIEDFNVFVPALKDIALASPSFIEYVPVHKSYILLAEPKDWSCATLNISFQPVKYMFYISI